MSQDPIQEALEANQRRADESMWKEINRILAGGPNAMSEADKGFLTARRSYLTEDQKEAFGIEEYVEPKTEKKTEKKTE
jgi:hypothetical protein